MELLYADPKRINVKKTSVFYRLEKITISHADPKFIKLLELGGAQVNIINGYVPWQDYKITQSITTPWMFSYQMYKF